MTRPLSELVADICRDLGLAPDWAKLAAARWARTEMRGEQVGAPLSALMAAKRPTRGAGQPLDSEPAVSAADTS